MFFKLKDFAGTEIKKYKVEKRTEGTLRNPQGEITETEYPMLIYKKTLKIYNPDIADGGRISGQLTGKILKKYPLELGDYIYIESEKYKVSEILPRLYADFKEFSLEKTDE